MMKILLLALLVATVSAVSLKLGNIKCTFGPSYWCQNYKQAKECDAVQHCREKVWKISPNISCVECKEALEVLKVELAKPSFQKQIISKLEGICVRFSALAPECRVMIEKYAPIMFKTLINMMANPEQFCKQLGLCKSSKEKVMAVLVHKVLPTMVKSLHTLSMKEQTNKVTKVEPVKASTKCVLCLFITDKLDQMLTKKATQEQIKDALDKVCSLLPSTIGTECQEFINAYSVEILQLLSQELSPKRLCASLGLCGQSQKKQVNMVHGNGEICDFCTTAITYFKNLLQDNATQKEFLDGLKELCKDLPEQLQSECLSAVSQYGAEVLKLIATADPKTLCKDIGLCTSKAKTFRDVIKIRGKCYYGASYWCANHSNAAKCKATAFCKKYVW